MELKSILLNRIIWLVPYGSVYLNESYLFLQDVGEITSWGWSILAICHEFHPSLKIALFVNTLGYFLVLIYTILVAKT